MHFTASRKLALALTALLYLVAAAGSYALISDQSWHTALAVPVSLLAALLGLSLVNYAVRAWRWILLCEYLGCHLSWRKNVLYYLAGYSLTSTPGKAGELVRLWFLKAGHGIAYGRSLPLAVADRIIDVWAVLILAVISVWQFADYQWQAALLVLVIGGVSMPILFARRFERVVASIYNVAPQCGRLLVQARRIAGAMAEMSSWRTYGLTLIPSIGGWLAECVAFFLLLKHFGADVSLLNAIFIFSFAMIVGAISMLPGGLGSTEATLVILLKALGVELDSALAATAIIRVTTLWFAVAMGVLLMPAAMRAATRAARDPAAQALVSS